MSGDCEVIVPVPPYHYIHVLDKNTNITRIVIGPQTYFRKDHERLIKAPQPMITVSSKEYCIIRNPIKKDSDGNIVMDKFGQALLSYGDEEYRFAQPSFPLYPGEELIKEVTGLSILHANVAFLLSAVVDFESEDGKRKVAGERWLFEGPGIYFPRKEVEVISTRKAEMILANTALLLRALSSFVDRTGAKRSYGETWLVKEVGAYMVGAYEDRVSVVNAYHLDEKRALHVRAKKTHTDDFGKRRRHGEEWLITHLDTESHIPSVNEEVVEVASPIILSSNHYCVVCDPVDDKGIPRIGKKLLVRGEKSFFLMPGERLHGGIETVYVLSEKEGIILRALESFHDESENLQRVAGEEWMLVGPLEYVPPITVEVLTVRKAIPLDENEGIYVRDKLSGHVRAVIGSTYMLNHNEELWQKKLPPLIEQLLMENKDPLGERGDYRKKASGEEWDSTRVVTYRIPHNSAVQVYDYKGKKARVVFGPERVMLGPDEQFTLLSLSGGKPKRPNVLKTICLLLGPDFCTDVLVVETADHARLSIQLSYNWYFDVPAQPTQSESGKLFSVPDFIGDFCKAIAARVRGAVASVNFDAFHKNSATIIRQSVFGKNLEGRIRDKFEFPQNNLVITSVDVQSVEPVDQRTRDALQKSVQLAIEITSNSQEAAARHEAERLEQEARGKLERQRIQDEATAEEARRGLLELQVQLAALESAGQAKAEAQSRAEAALITTQAEVQKAELESQADEIRTNGELKRMKLAREQELEYLKSKNELELKRKKQEIEIETSYYLKRVEAIGAENLRFIACAGPDRDIRMLRALNLKSTLITDGRTPISLLDATAGLIGQASSTIHSLPQSDPTTGSTNE